MAPSVSKLAFVRAGVVLLAPHPRLAGDLLLCQGLFFELVHQALRVILWRGACPRLVVKGRGDKIHQSSIHTTPDRPPKRLASIVQTYPQQFDLIILVGKRNRNGRRPFLIFEYFLHLARFIKRLSALTGSAHLFLPH